MRDRSAIDTIKGYFYQFDYSIDCLINLTDENHEITVEGIEDIDIEQVSDKTAIQCKYYSKTEYNHSVIAKPIRLMLEHFSDTKKKSNQTIKYKLRGHYKSGHEKLKLPLTIETLKNDFLTFTSNKVKFEHHNTLGLNDNELQEFLNLLEIDINACEFEKQNESIVSKLKSHFKCSDFTAQNYYYNNALNEIKKLTVKSTLSERTISKKIFFQNIDNSKILFNEWFLKLKGEREYFSSLRKEYFTFLNVSPFERFFLIEIDTMTYNRDELKEFLLILSKKWSKTLKRESTPFCPYVYIHNIEENELIELKKEIIKESFYIYDGFDFQGAEFNVHSILRQADYNNKVGLKIINSMNFIEEILNNTSKRKEIYQFYRRNTFYSQKNTSIKHIQIQFEKISHLKNII